MSGWWPRSVRARTTLFASALAALMLGLAGWALVSALESSLESATDDLSQARASALAAQVRDGTLTEQVVDLGEDGMAQVVNEGGEVLASSSGLEGSSAVVTVEEVGDEPRLLVLHDIQDDDETEDYRTWTLRADGPGGLVAVVVGNSLESVDEATGALRRGLLVGVPLLVALMAAGTWVIVSWSLRPVERIRAEVATITDADLGHRVPVPPTRDELERLAETMNEMLDRVEQGVLRQREFVGDASHELQSPLTSLRTQLEVAIAHPGEDWSTATRDLLADTLRMERLVRDLLVLARDDAGGERDRHDLVDLDVILHEEVRRARSTSPVPIEAVDLAAGPVRGNPDDVARLVRNLLENAGAHACSRVEVSLRTTDTDAIVEVGDDGPGIPPDQRERVFERFARVDDDRARPDASVSGTGLGLAIARGIAERHSGTLRVAATEAPGAKFVLTMPLAAPDGESAQAGIQQKP